MSLKTGEAPLFRDDDDRTAWAEACNLDEAMAYSRALLARVQAEVRGTHELKLNVSATDEVGLLCQKCEAPPSLFAGGAA